MSSRNSINGVPQLSKHESMTKVTYMETKQFLMARGIDTKDIRFAPTKFHLKMYAERAGVDISALLGSKREAEKAAKEAEAAAQAAAQAAEAKAEAEAAEAAAKAEQAAVRARAESEARLAAEEAERKLAAEQ